MATAPKTSSKTLDNRIHDDVCLQFMWQTDIESQEIDVEVDNSVVFLSGHVETCLDRLEAEKAAKAVYGVTSVINNIELDLKHPRTDCEIADDLVASLRMVACGLEELPTVSVEAGVAVLKGRVRWNFQRASAEKAADAVVGVRRVVNLIEVIPFGCPTQGKQANRKRVDAKPPSENDIDSRSASCSRPLFVVPSQSSQSR